MHRKVLINWFSSAKGRTLQRQEAAFLAHSITVSCQQVVVQIGALSWEESFIDSSLYKAFVVIDDEQLPSASSPVIKAESDYLPIQTASVDMVILPHLLEFESDKHQVLREVERILKPEAKLLMLGFNPWNLYVNMQYMRYKVKGAPWLPSLVSRTRIQDWLRLLNFEVEVAAGFNFDACKREFIDVDTRKYEMGVVAYAIKAIKRCYKPIDMTPVRDYKSGFAMAKIMDGVPVKQEEYQDNKEYYEKN